MPSTPRPSAPSTSTRATRTSTPAAAIDSAESSANTPRKPPHCKTCGRPRKGHPLRGCEVDRSPSPKTDPPPKKNPSPKKDPSPKKATIVADPHPPSTLVDSLLAMNLEERDRKEKRDRRRSVAQQRPADLQSLPSMSTTTGELLESLKAPGLLADDHDGESESEKRDAVMRWRETSGVPRARASVVPLAPPTDQSPALLADATPTKKRHRATPGH
ncbi:hypothetical protein C8R47DRAFT_1160429 [Mycena vitilis]|nr:hypothetical protein C8R47DRAFT_1160429 [Mycena vitilis]